MKDFLLLVEARCEQKYKNTFKCNLDENQLLMFLIIFASSCVAIFCHLATFSSFIKTCVAVCHFTIWMTDFLFNGCVHYFSFFPSHGSVTLKLRALNAPTLKTNATVTSGGSRQPALYTT